MSELLDRRKAAIVHLVEAYTQAMQNGNKLRNMAAEMRAWADQASDDYVRMRDEYREQNSGRGDLINDAQYAGKDVAVKARGDNQWYLQRAQTYSGEAAMYYAQATAIMGNIQYERSMIEIPLIRD